MNVSTITSTDDARHVYSVTFPDDHDAVHHHQFDVSGPPARFLESCEIAHPRFAKGHPVCPRLAERIAHRLFDIQPQESTRLIGELIAQEVIQYCRQAIHSPTGDSVARAQSARNQKAAACLAVDAGMGAAMYLLREKTEPDHGHD
jgi:hypothetical protein